MYWQWIIIIAVVNFCTHAGSLITSKLFEIRYINLKRQPQKRINIESELGRVFDGYVAKRVEAVDGLSLSHWWMADRCIAVMAEFDDPNIVGTEYRSDHPMKWGEVACFMSHYQIWTEMAAKRLELVLILEDDTKFILEDEKFDLHNFHYDLNATIEEFIFHQGELLYLGRCRIGEDIKWKSLKYLVRPGFSFCTHAYMLTLEGARKLISTDILSRIIPVDEYLPLMYGQNPHFDIGWWWGQHKKNETSLKAFAAKWTLAQQYSRHASDTYNSLPVFEYDESDFD